MLSQRQLRRLLQLPSQENGGREWDQQSAGIEGHKFFRWLDEYVKFAFGDHKDEKVAGENLVHAWILARGSRSARMKIVF